MINRPLDLTRYRRHGGQLSGPIRYRTRGGQLGALARFGSQRDQLGFSFGTLLPPTNQSHSWDIFNQPIGGTPSYNPTSGNVVQIGPAQPVTAGQQTSSTFQTIAALISQGFAAFGQHPSNQVYGSGVNPLSNPGTDQSNAAAAASIANSMALQGNRSATVVPGGGFAEGLFGGLTGSIQQYPLVWAAGAVGVYLLFRDPPRRR